MASLTTERELNPRDAERMLKEHPQAQLVDVREVDEYRDGHLRGSRLISLSTLAVRLDELDPNRPILFYCHSGNRSGQALAFAQQRGYRHAKHIRGGISAWESAGLPIEV